MEFSNFYAMLVILDFFINALSEILDAVQAC